MFPHKDFPAAALSLPCRKTHVFTSYSSHQRVILYIYLFRYAEMIYCMYQIKYSIYKYFVNTCFLIHDDTFLHRSKDDMEQEYKRGIKQGN